MTLYTYKHKKEPIFVYLGVSALCVAIHLIYSRFSHGVSSAWMTWMFLWPLAGGCIPSLLISRLPAGLHPDAGACMLFRFGLSACAMASLLKGILEIAGTASFHTDLMLRSGILLMIFAAVWWLAKIVRRNVLV